MFWLTIAGTMTGAITTGLAKDLAWMKDGEGNAPTVVSGAFVGMISGFSIALINKLFIKVNCATAVKDAIEDTKLQAEAEIEKYKNLQAW
tara:strand:- start:252 stop:521 length:270 start_codon:yes stop_codon:yes gene_type:complete